MRHTINIHIFNSAIDYLRACIISLILIISGYISYFRFKRNERVCFILFYFAPCLIQGIKLPRYLLHSFDIVRDFMLYFNKLFLLKNMSTAQKIKINKKSHKITRSLVLHVLDRKSHARSVQALHGALVFPHRLP